MLFITSLITSTLAPSSYLHFAAPLSPFAKTKQHDCSQNKPVRRKHHNPSFPRPRARWAKKANVPLHFTPLQRRDAMTARCYRLDAHGNLTDCERSCMCTWVLREMMESKERERRRWLQSPVRSEAVVLNYPASSPHIT
ncbi:hypothetical protein B0T18DRAFT_412026 [Schizothecium vesticola]|uniref:Uncharacterized protein n=1 Tax=Schizothecium vesticola TaxID=314040 RepID=A0AA40EWG5_9PEZI|nr:hypothetical protein B0T18DRAFT_412026 [Schizothecium vesticola]